MNKTTKIRGLMLSLLLACGGAHGAGLGKLSVQSALGQPFKAEIELLSVDKDELPGVSARLASIELFRKARIKRSEALASLEFEVAKRNNGQPVIRISSRAPITEPFLDLLIELSWSTGRIIREYAVLLDPPMNSRAPVQVATVEPVAPVDAARESMPADTTKPVPDAEKPVSKPVPKAPPSYGPVKQGETLMSIAGRVKAPNVTLEQMMVGLYLTNKSAFISNNMNLLKKGAVLNVPTSEAIHQQVSHSQALRLFKNHVKEWHAYRSKVAEMAGEMPKAQAEGQAAAGKIVPKVEDQAPPSSAPKDVLKVSKGGPALGGKPDAKTQEHLQALEEELAAKSRALRESQDRVSQLEQTVRDMQRLLDLKSQKAAEAGAAPQTPPPERAAPPKVAPPPLEPAVAKAPPTKPAPVPALPPATLEEESSWLSTFISNPLYIGGVVAAGLLSGLLWMMMVGSRRRQILNKFEDSIMTGGELKSVAVLNTNTTGTANEAAVGGANTEGSMLLTNLSRLGLGAIDTHEVDPIAEAEVYMAYGRDAQAEEILKEALERDSSRHEVALKLLEIYAARKDPLAFETTASELYASLGGQDTPIWQRAAEMGRSIDPENPLYRMAQGQSFASAPEMPAPVAEETVAAAAQADQNTGIDFVSSEAAPALKTPAEKVSEPEDLTKSQDQGLDFTYSFDLPTAKVPVQETVQEPEDLLAQEPEAEPPAELHEVAIDLPPVSSEKPEEFAVDLGELKPEADMKETKEESVPEFHIETEAPKELASESMEGLGALELKTAEQAPAMPDLDFGNIDLELEAAPAEEAPTEEEPVSAADLDFESQVEAPTAVEAEAPVEAEAAPAPEMDPKLWEEVNTKLDLARAYLELGDREGAREILQEITQEGDAKQKSEAEKLLSEAG